jgi:hypothetical protein
MDSMLSLLAAYVVIEGRDQFLVCRDWLPLLIDSMDMNVYEVEVPRKGEGLDAHLSRAPARSECDESAFQILLL